MIERSLDKLAEAMKPHREKAATVIAEAVKPFAVDWEPEVKDSTVIGDADQEYGGGRFATPLPWAYPALLTLSTRSLDQ